MTELITTFLITATSIFFLCYWFHYTCMLILSAKTARDYSNAVASANQLDFLRVQALLGAKCGKRADMDGLLVSLDKDYAILQKLYAQTKHLRPQEEGLERWMLGSHYRLASIWYRLSRSFAPTAACRSLEQMSLVIAHFANSMGEQMAAA